MVFSTFRHILFFSVFVLRPISLAISGAMEFFRAKKTGASAPALISSVFPGGTSRQ
jgi:hypothetical protein